MIFGLNRDGNRINARNARRSDTYFCPICGNNLILRAGVIKMAHFAHHSNIQCTDTWKYDNSDFKRMWQNMFEDDEREVLIENNNIRHLADVVSQDCVIEFQSEKIGTNEFIERNKFFIGLFSKVVWMFDLSEQYENGDIQLDETTGTGVWNSPLRAVRSLGNSRYNQSNITVFAQVYEKEESGKILSAIIKLQDLCFDDNKNVSFKYGHIIDAMEFLTIFNSNEQLNVITTEEITDSSDCSDCEAKLKKEKGRTILDLWKMNYRVAIFKNIKTGVKVKIFDDQAEKALKSTERKWMGFIKSEGFKLFTSKPMEVFGSDKREWKTEWFVTHQDAKY